MNSELKLNWIKNVFKIEVYESVCKFLFCCLNYIDKTFFIKIDVYKNKNKVYLKKFPLHFSLRTLNVTTRLVIVYTLYWHPWCWSSSGQTTLTFAFKTHVPFQKNRPSCVFCCVRIWTCACTPSIYTIYNFETKQVAPSC